MLLTMHSSVRSYTHTLIPHVTSVFAVTVSGVACTAACAGFCATLLEVVWHETCFMPSAAYCLRSARTAVQVSDGAGGAVFGLIVALDASFNAGGAVSTVLVMAGVCQFAPVSPSNTTCSPSTQL